MKLTLLDRTERFSNKCFLCGGYPIKYRADVRMPKTGTVYEQVCLCNRCALEKSDMLVDKNDTFGGR